MLAVRLNINVQLGRASLNPPDLCLKLGGTSSFHAATSVNVNVTATNLRVAAVLMLMRICGCIVCSGNCGNSFWFVVTLPIS